MAIIGNESAVYVSGADFHRRRAISELAGADLRLGIPSLHNFQQYQNPLGVLGSRISLRIQLIALPPEAAEKAPGVGQVVLRQQHALSGPLGL